MFAEGHRLEKEGIEDFKGSRYDIKIWDEEGFKLGRGSRLSRCLKVEEVRRTERKAGYGREHQLHSNNLSQSAGEAVDGLEDHAREVGHREQSIP